MNDAKTLVLGASENPGRYANIALRRLRSYGHNVVAVGRSKGQVDDVPIADSTEGINGIDTVTLYLNPQHQKQFYDYLLNLKPRRVIFNPGTENYELERRLSDAGIEPIEACTLVMLSTGEY